jgi:hypothetical protein
MKKWSFILFIAVVLLSVGCDSRSEQAAAYNDRLIERQVYVLDAFNDLDSSLSSIDTSYIDEAYHILRGRIKESLREVQQMNDFKGDAELKNATIDLFRGYDELAAGPYNQLIDLISLPDSSFTPRQQLRALELEDDIINGSASLHQSYAKRQQAFGERYNVTFEE